MRSTITLFAVLVMFIANSCKKEGCMDKEAENYDSKAKVESGNCEYNANQMAVMKLEGKWNVVAESYNDDNYDPESFEHDVYHFRNCESKSTGCAGTLITKDPDFGDYSSNFRYSVSDNGKTLKISAGFNSEEFEIKELTNKMLIIEQNYFGDIHKVSMEKM
jgi:hypothetical protein